MHPFVLLILWLRFMLKCSRSILVRDNFMGIQIAYVDFKVLSSSPLVSGFLLSYRIHDILGYTETSRYVRMKRDRVWCYQRIPPSSEVRPPEPFEEMGIQFKRLVSGEGIPGGDVAREPSSKGVRARGERY